MSGDKALRVESDLNAVAQQLPPLAGKPTPAVSNIKSHGGLPAATQRPPGAAAKVTSVFKQNLVQVDRDFQAKAADPDATKFLREQLSLYGSDDDDEPQANALQGDMAPAEAPIANADAPPADAPQAEALQAGAQAVAQSEAAAQPAAAQAAMHANQEKPPAREIAADVNSKFQSVIAKAAENPVASEAFASLIHNSPVPVQAHVDQANGHGAQAQANQGSQAQHPSPAAANAPAAQQAEVAPEQGDVAPARSGKVAVKAEQNEAAASRQPLAQQSESEPAQAASKSAGASSAAKKESFAPKEVAHNHLGFVKALMEETVMAYRKVIRKGQEVFEVVDKFAKEHAPDYVFYDTKTHSIHAKDSELIESFKQNKPEDVEIDEDKCFYYSNWDACMDNFFSEYEQALLEKAEAEALLQQHANGADLKNFAKQHRSESKEAEREEVVVQSKADTFIRNATGKQIQKQTAAIKRERQEKEKLRKEEEKADELKKTAVENQVEKAEDKEIILGAEATKKMDRTNEKLYHSAHGLPEE